MQYNHTEVKIFTQTIEYNKTALNDQNQIVRLKDAPCTSNWQALSWVRRELVLHVK